MRLGRWLAALALVVAGVSFTAAPATAASGYCTGSGVNVVVDFGALVHRVDEACGNGSSAARVFEDAGFSLRYGQTGGMQGFVCTVNKQPEDGKCSGANGEGYWALFVGKPGRSWVYASAGADGLTVGNDKNDPVGPGDTVAFAWQTPTQASSGSSRVPGTAPAPVYVAPKPPATASPLTSTAPTVKPSRTSTAKPSPSASPSAMTSVQAPVKSTESKDNGLPWWIPVGVGALLVAGAIGTWLRKRSS